MPEPTKISAVEFAAKIKAKYPEYQDISDVELAQKMVAKYPEYVNVVELGEPQPVKKKTLVNQFQDWLNNLHPLLLFRKVLRLI